VQFYRNSISASEAFSKSSDKGARVANRIVLRLLKMLWRYKTSNSKHGKSQIQENLCCSILSLLANFYLLYPVIFVVLESYRQPFLTNVAKESIIVVMKLLVSGKCTANQHIIL